MVLMKEVILADSIEIKTTPEKIFDFLVNLVDDESCCILHPKDHVALRWFKGKLWEKGSVVYAEEYIHGKLNKLKFLVTKVTPNRKIEYVPLSRFLRRYFSLNMFIMEPKGETCVFTVTSIYRFGWLVRTSARKKLEQDLLSIKKHMREEGENLKRILEAEGGTPGNL